jgi:hypothetical protein
MTAKLATQRKNITMTVCQVCLQDSQQSMTMAGRHLTLVGAFIPVCDMLDHLSTHCEKEDRSLLVKLTICYYRHVSETTQYWDPLSPRSLTGVAFMPPIQYHSAISTDHFYLPKTITYVTAVPLATSASTSPIAISLGVLHAWEYRHQPGRRASS